MNIYLSYPMNNLPSQIASLINLPHSIKRVKVTLFHLVPSPEIEKLVTVKWEGGIFYMQMYLHSGPKEVSIMCWCNVNLVLIIKWSKWTIYNFNFL